MEWILKNWPSLLILFAGIAASIGSYISSSKDGIQKDEIQRLGEENVRLTREITKLQEINFSLLDSLSKSVKKTSEENLQSGIIDLSFYSKLNDDEKVEVTIAGNTYGNSVKNYRSGFIPLQIGNRPVITFKFNNENSLLISAKVFDSDDNLIAEIEDNYWRPNKNFSAKYNYDDKGFEVIDNKDNVALSVTIKKNNEIVVFGIFPDKETKSLAICGEGGTFFISMPISNSELRKTIKHVRLKKQFLYTGENWLHKRR